MRNWRYHFWITLSTISLVGIITFVVTFILLLFLTINTFVGSFGVLYRGIIITGIAFIITFIVELIYNIIKNRPNMG